MDDERQITGDEEPASGEPDTGPATTPADQDPDRIERLRALLTAPIRIPESEAGGSPAADEYPAPAADIPPHVRAAAEAAAQAGHRTGRPEGDTAPDRPVSGSGSAASDGERDEPRRTVRKRRTWADAFLDTGTRAIPGADGDAATQLMTRLDDLDRRTGQDIARTRSTAERAADSAQEAHDLLASVTEQLAANRQATTDLTATGDTLSASVDTLCGATDTLRSALDALEGTVADQHTEHARLADTLADQARAGKEARQATDEARAQAADARTEAAAAAKRATTALVLAVVATLAALAGIGLGVAL